MEDYRLLISEMEILIERASAIANDDSQSDDGSNEISVHTEDLPTAVNSLHTYVTRLLDLLPSMEDLFNYADRVHVDAQQSTIGTLEVSRPAWAYIRSIYDRFKKADSSLVERLGEANWRRHVALRNKPTIGQDDEEEEEVDENAEKTPKQAFVPVSMFHDSGVSTSLPE
ncbi:hypothetical protein G7Y89_g5589 [Cudoniella acicularis]|uniref:Uncharacterized protein n=1 Tax=Cudoniella acicularis TaxID=354080 RepID=A0A8H4RQF0_9HELO|nr:hypothetical protein G7Y89_g5589 [Cudoniella acicularis]